MKKPKKKINLMKQDKSKGPDHWPGYPYRPHLPQTTMFAMLRDLEELVNNWKSKLGCR